MIMIITGANRAGMRLAAAAVFLLVFPSTGLACVDQVAGLPGGPAPADDITIAGDLAVVSSRWAPRAWVVDVSDPLQPVELSAFPVVPYRGRMAIEDGYAYVAVRGGDDGEDGVSIVSIDDPLSPTEVGFAPLDIQPEDVAVQWPYVFAVGESRSFSGLVLLDVRAPWTPIRVAMVEIGYEPYSITVAGGYAYVGRRGCPWAVPECGPSLQIVDVSSPSDPVLLGATWPVGPPEPEFRNGFVLGWTAYGLGVIDCRNPLAPELAYLDYVVPPPWSSSDFELGGGKAYATTYQGLKEPIRSGLYVYDVRNPALPRNIGRREVPGRGTGVAVTGDYVFVAGGEAGIVVYDAGACGLPAPRRTGGRALP